MQKEERKLLSEEELDQGKAAGLFNRWEVTGQERHSVMLPLSREGSWLRNAKELFKRSGDGKRVFHGITLVDGERCILCYSGFPERFNVRTAAIPLEEYRKIVI